MRTTPEKGDKVRVKATRRQLDKIHIPYLSDGDKGSVISTFNAGRRPEGLSVRITTDRGKFYIPPVFLEILT